MLRPVLNSDFIRSIDTISLTMNILKEFYSRIFHDIKQNYIALSIVIVYLVIAQWIFHTVCPFAILTGLPCPACGLTRGALLFFSGDFQAAAGMNPAIYLWLPFLSYLFVYRYFFGKKPPFILPLTILVCLITIFIYEYRLITGTPVAVPCPGILQIDFKIFL